MRPKSESRTLQEESSELTVLHVSGEFTGTALFAANAEGIADVVEELIA
jgi:muconolactone delta-isomerase